MAEIPNSSTHPPLPPTTEEDRFDWLRLLRSRRVGVVTFWRLLEECGTARKAIEALPDIARSAGVADYQICPEGVVMAEVRAAQAAGARMLCAGGAGYPAVLSDLADAPPILWARGDVTLLSRPMIALVGARNASSLGTRMARKLAAELGEAGFVVVSGLARGIDAAAHLAALPTGTVAVMAGGVDVIYPVENAGLAGQIFASGVLLSEQPMGLEPQARHFPARNRIVSGLSACVVVVEAAARSGSLITARNALDQGRDVLAVPGHPFDARAAGCNLLLRDGATLVRSAADVIEALGHVTRARGLTATLPADPDLPRATVIPLPPPRSATPSHTVPPSHAGPASHTVPPPCAVPNSHFAPTSQPRSLRETAALHARILDRLSPSPLAEDQLIRDLASSSQLVSPVLMELELDGRISRQAGGLLARLN